MIDEIKDSVVVVIIVSVSVIKIVIVIVMLLLLLLMISKYFEALTAFITYLDVVCEVHFAPDVHHQTQSSVNT
jgi:hypothetical protein